VRAIRRIESTWAPPLVRDRPVRSLVGRTVRHRGIAAVSSR
jgi:hypothetical protein